MYNYTYMYKRSIYGIIYIKSTAGRRKKINHA